MDLATPGSLHRLCNSRSAKSHRPPPFTAAGSPRGESSRGSGSAATVASEQQVFGQG
jgi:hypothetical protein